MTSYAPVLRVAACVAALVFSASTSAQNIDALAQGEIRKVDKAAGKLTIKHGDIPSIDMPPMTMVFTVNDPALLDKAKAGDKIRFDAENKGGKYVVTRIEVER